jgi:hypothetical protein
MFIAHLNDSKSSPRKRRPRFFWRFDFYFYLGFCFCILIWSQSSFAQDGEVNTINIPVNGYSDSNEPDSEIKEVGVYAAEISEALECHALDCESQIIKQLNEYYDSEFNDFYAMYSASSNDLRLNSKALDKLKGLRMLEQFLRKSNYDKAADHLESLFNRSLKKLLEQTQDSRDRNVFLKSFSANNQEIQNAIQDSCGSIDAGTSDTATPPKALTQSQNSTDKNWDKQNKKMCGILTSEIILSALARGSSFFAGNEQNYYLSDYQCKGIRLAIDRSETIWRPDPDRPKLLYVIHRDNSVYRLDDKDLAALQNATAQHLKNKRRSQIKTEQGSLKIQSEIFEDPAQR